MKKNISIILFLCFFLNITFVNAQNSLTAATAQSTAVESSNSDNVWNDVVSTSLNLTAGVKVLVEATIEVVVAAGNSDINTLFRLTDGTNFSQTISRYVVSKSYTDKGIAAISFIFDYGAGFTGPKTFTLQQAKTTPGNPKVFSSKAVITAIEIVSSNVDLPNGQATAASVTTTNVNYEPVASTSVVLENKADIYIVSTFSTSTTSPSAFGGWALRQDNTLISEITRNILSSAAIGAGTIVTLVKNVDPGTYTFDLAHKTTVVSDNIITTGATISVVVLRGTIATGDDIFPSYSDSTPSATSTTDTTYSDITTASIIAPTNTFTDNKFFMHASYNIGATDDNVAYATYKFGSTVGTLPLFEIQRYVLDGTTGSGGLIGIVSGINEGTTFNTSFQHKNSGATGTLTSSNVNTIGFFLNSDPFSTLSVEQDILNTNISIFPNPAKEQFYINNNVTDGETSFKFYTVTGQLLHTINVMPKTNTKVNVTDWASGIYIIKAANNGINIAKKIIIE